MVQVTEYDYLKKKNNKKQGELRFTIITETSAEQSQLKIKIFF